VFIPRENSQQEDDGYVMALRHDTSSNTSDLAIFDAHALDADPVAVVHLPVRVPNGFHGNWVPDVTS
jgi:carotenoid cleavage dioxygenase